MMKRLLSNLVRFCRTEDTLTIQLLESMYVVYPNFNETLGEGWVVLLLLGSSLAL